MIFDSADTSNWISLIKLWLWTFIAFPFIGLAEKVVLERNRKFSRQHNTNRIIDKNDTSEMWGMGRERTETFTETKLNEKVVIQKNNVKTVYLLNFWFWSDSGISQSGAAPSP